MAMHGFSDHQYQITIRFFQGYRYLDLCGEALVSLERTLDPGWIPVDAAAKGGSIRNDAIGMAAAFNAESVTVQQSESLDFEVFLDQAGKVFDVLRSTFRVDRVISPAMTINYQRQFPSADSDEADKVLRELAIFGIPDKLRRTVGEPASLAATLLGNDGDSWNNVPARIVRRVEARVVKQTSTPPFDARLLRRATLLPENQRQALIALEKVRAKQVPRSSVAIQIDLETLLEGEFDKAEFPIHDFISQARTWATEAATRLTST